MVIPHVLLKLFLKAENKKKETAYIGEIHPSILQNFQIEMPVAGFEVDVDELI